MPNDEVSHRGRIIQVEGGKRVLFRLRAVGGYADDFRKVSAQRFSRRSPVTAYLDLGKCLTFETFDQHEIARPDIGANLVEWQLGLVTKFAH